MVACEERKNDRKGGIATFWLFIDAFSEPSANAFNRIARKKSSQGLNSVCYWWRTVLLLRGQVSTSKEVCLLTRCLTTEHVVPLHFARQRVTFDSALIFMLLGANL